jgi:uncharacterized coiled-coil protein SlyX
MYSIVQEVLKTIMIIVVFCMIGFYVFQNMNIQVSTVSKIYNNNEKIANINEDIIKTNTEIEKIKQQFNILTQLSEKQREELFANKLNEKILTNNNELNKIKDLLLQTPERAIALERLSLKQKNDTILLKQQIKSLEKQLASISNYNVALVIALVTISYLTQIFKRSQHNCQVQSKNAPECSAKVHHLVTPIC